MSVLETFLAQHPAAPIAVVGEGPLAIWQVRYPQATLLGLYDPVGDRPQGECLSVDQLRTDGCRGLIIARQLIAYRAEFAALRKLCTQAGWELWTPEGVDLTAALDHAEAQREASFALTAAELRAAIDAHDTISFDIFDTLLQRCTLTPGDVFAMVERKALQRGLPGEDFPTCRQAAQLDSGLDNPDLDEIYRMYRDRYHLAPEQAEALKALELEVESQVLRARADMAEIFRYAIDQGKRVILTTDMYLPGSVLAPLLAREGFTGYDALLVSCEKKCLKLNGLFAELRKQATGRILHIGDHHIYDGVCAELAGIDYGLVASQELCLQRCGLQETMTGLQNLNERGLLGMGSAKAFSSPFRLHIDAGGFHPDAAQLSALYFAPLVAGFLHWFTDALTRNPCDGILFAARDGAPMLRWYEDFCAAFPNLSLPEGKYFYTSRRAATLCNMDNEAAINAIVDSSRMLPPDVMMQQKFDLPAQEIQPPTAQDSQEIYRYVWRHQQAIFDRAKLARQGYYHYMGQLGLQMGGRYAFYDFVSSGTSQKGLSSFTPFTLQGLYFASTATADRAAVPIESFLGADADYFQHQFKRLELFMTSDEGSLAALDENGMPLFAPDHRSQAVIEYAHTCQQQITDWLQRYFRVLYDPNLPLRTETAGAIFEEMRRADLSGFDALELSDDWNGSQETLSTYCETPVRARQHAANEAAVRDAWREFCLHTPMRSSLLNWYDFGPDCTVVLLGASPLAELLCQRCARVIVIEQNPLHGESLAQNCAAYDNFTLQIGHFPAFRPEVQADVVVVPQLQISAGKRVGPFLQAARELLAPGGKMLLVVQNRFGLKYFCGVPAEKTQAPFAGLEDPTGFSRAGIQALLENVGLSSMKFYYPMPDARLPQAIYTDAYQPTDGLRDRVIPYYDSTKTLVAAEDKLWDEILRNRMLPFFANDFLVEAHKGDAVFDDTLFAALSTDRGSKDGFVTAIHENHRVTKTPIAPEGQETLQHLCETQQALQACGVRTVPCTYADGRLTMPFVEGKNLVSQLSELAHAGQPERFAQLLEGLWQQILKSSPTVPSEACALPLSAALLQQAGPILARACIDMIPFNCFYTEGNYLFYDQEFVRQNYPASYVLFRALRYTYGFAPDAEAMLPLAELKQRYGLTDALWEAYEQEEARFIEENRNYEAYEPFYQHAGAPAEVVKANRARLQDQALALPTTRDDKAEREVLLRLLQAFDAVCRQNNLHYTLFYGTLLGAVRHQGFVPWDDDVDVIMPRADYDKLCALPPNAWAAEYFLQTPESDPDCFYGGYAKLRDSTTTGIESRNLGHNCNQGIWIDILPLDACWRNPERRQDQFARIHRLQSMLLAKIYPGLYQLDSVTALQVAQTSHRDLCDQLHAALTECDEPDALLTVLARYRSAESHVLTEAEDWRWTIPQPFEGTQYPIPMAYDKLLRQLYGPQYRLYPPLAQRVSHHKGLFDAGTPYRQYQAEHATLLAFFSNL